MFKGSITNKRALKWLIDWYSGLLSQLQVATVATGGGAATAWASRASYRGWFSLGTFRERSEARQNSLGSMLALRTRSLFLTFAYRA